MAVKLREVSPVPTFTFNPPSPVDLTPAPTQAPASTSTSDLGSGSTPAPVPAPPTNPSEFILAKDQTLFGAHPLETERGKGLLKCVKCGKVVTEAVASEHKRICAHVLEGIPLNNKKSVVKKTETLKRRASEASSETESPSKKRQKLPGGDDDSDLPALPSFPGMKKADIKKVKKERERLEKKTAKQQAKVEAQERKRMRASEPIDLDRQCGVINDKGLPCSRSLTCKTHTVGSKRAVEGRSRSYDLLYLEWQRANNPNFKEPQKPGRKEKPEHEKKKTTSKKKWGEFSMNGMAGGDHEGIGDGEEGQKELGDMIAFARMAGERCKTVVGNIGSGWDTLPNGQVRGAKSRKSATVTGGPMVAGGSGSGSTSGAVTNGNGTTTTSSTTNANGVAPTGPGNVTSANTNAPTNGTPATTTTTTAGANPAIPPAPINKGTIPFSASSAFRTAMTEFNGVGDMFTKALATRKRDPQAGHVRVREPTNPSGVAMNRGIPSSMVTGGVKGTATTTAHIQPLQAQASTS